ncbi:tyrosine-type recombinase/integrase [Mycolicibacter arupensis]|uniref:tyrosine-type recombinase/integrase n=1 Tax=Mycolicibacter arupensis TaxID=342002 RepID=UPI001F3E94DF|nr:tyrosine-type recombinase/integrase [Mycolicibacter arupensis]
MVTYPTANDVQPASSVTPLLRCEIATAAGRCRQPARWRLDCHGCTSGAICTGHLRDWQRKTAARIGSGGAPCSACGRKFETVDAAGTVVALAVAGRVERDRAAAPVDVLGRYDTFMRGAGRSSRWISESLRTLGNLAALAGTTLDQCRPEHVSEFLASPALGAGSRATYFRQINSFYTWWAKQGGTQITEDLPRPREPRGEPRPLTSKQVEQLVATPMHSRTRVMILLAVLAGLRVHEIAKLRGEDVDLGRGLLHVTGKGGVTATLPLHPLLADAAATMPRNGFWFPANATRPGEHILGKSVSHIVSLVCGRAGIPGGTAHKLRHWYGTTLLHDGADVRTVQTLLRHSSLTTTQRYTLVTDERRRQAISRLEIGGRQDD